MATLNVLQAERARLLNELARVEEAIASFADATPVKIETGKNLRNTPGVTWNPKDAAEGYMMVFADKAMTTAADRASHGGWVTNSALAEYKLKYPYWGEMLRVLE